MSRSYKRSAVMNLRHDMYYKRLAHTRNRMRERQGIFLSSRQVKYLVDSWDICDYKSYIKPSSKYYIMALRK